MYKTREALAHKLGIKGCTVTTTFYVGSSSGFLFITAYHDLLLNLQAYK